jgi:hypothetical protein
MPTLNKLRGEIDELLTQVALGYTNNEFIGKKILPQIISDTERVKLRYWAKENFKLYETKRALRGDSNIAELDDLSYASYDLQEHDLGFPLDWREEDASQMFNLRRHAVNTAMEALDLGQEKEIVDLVFNATNFPTGHKEALTNTDIWDHADSDPIEQIQDARLTIRQAIVKDANTLVLGEASWTALRNHAMFVDKLKYHRMPILTIELLKQFLEIDNILIGKGVYLNTATDEFVDLWGDKALLCYVDPSPSPNKFAPSFGYSFQKRNYPNVTIMTNENGKVITPLVTRFYGQDIVMPHAGYLISNTRSDS